MDRQYGSIIYSLCIVWQCVSLLDAVNDDRIVNTDRPQKDETAPEEQPEEPAAANQQTIVNRRTLPGWDRVAELAEALRAIKGF